MFETFLVKPLLNLLIFLYTIIPGHDLGTAVIVITVLVRLALWPLFVKSIKSRFILNKIQPEILALQKKYKNDQKRQVAELLELYKRHKFNPFSAFFSLFIQLPIIIALYRVFLVVTSEYKHLLYSWVTSPDLLNYSFFGWFDLTQPYLLIVLLASLAQFAQIVLSFSSFDLKPSTKQNETALQLSKTFALLSPVLTFFIFRPLPSVLSLYWLVTTVISTVQQGMVQKKFMSQNVSQ